MAKPLSSVGQASRTTQVGVSGVRQFSSGQPRIAKAESLANDIMNILGTGAKLAQEREQLTVDAAKRVAVDSVSNANMDIDSFLANLDENSDFGEASNALESIRINYDMAFEDKDAQRTFSDMYASNIASSLSKARIKINDMAELQRKNDIRSQIAYAIQTTPNMDSSLAQTLAEMLSNTGEPLATSMIKVQDGTVNSSVYSFSNRIAIANEQELVAKMINKEGTWNFDNIKMFIDDGFGSFGKDGSLGKVEDGKFSLDFNQSVTEENKKKISDTVEALFNTIKGVKEKESRNFHDLRYALGEMKPQPSTSANVAQMEANRANMKTMEIKMQNQTATKDEENLYFDMQQMDIKLRAHNDFIKNFYSIANSSDRMVDLLREDFMTTVTTETGARYPVAIETSFAKKLLDMSADDTANRVLSGQYNANDKQFLVNYSIAKDSLGENKIPPVLKNFVDKVSNGDVSRFMSRDDVAALTNKISVVSDIYRRANIDHPIFGHDDMVSTLNQSITSIIQNSGLGSTEAGKKELTDTINAIGVASRNLLNNATSNYSFAEKNNKPYVIKAARAITDGWTDIGEALPIGTSGESALVAMSSLEKKEILTDSDAEDFVDSHVGLLSNWKFKNIFPWSNERRPLVIGGNYEADALTIALSNKVAKDPKYDVIKDQFGRENNSYHVSYHFDNAKRLVTTVQLLADGKTIVGSYSFTVKELEQAYENSDLAKKSGSIPTSKNPKVQKLGTLNIK